MHLILATNIFKLAQVIVLSGIKFLFGPVLAIGYGFNYLQTVAITTIGGIAGMFFFYFLSKWLIKQYYKFCPILITYFGGEEARKRLEAKPCGQNTAKKFNRKNKRIISIRQKYGYLGVILFTPVLLSIPIGAFLAQKYYSRRKSVIFYLSLSILFWSACISSVYFLF